MGILKRLLGQHPEKAEQKGDDYFNNALWGRAKLEYEKALGQSEKNFEVNGSAKERLQIKLRLAEEALAREHCETAEDLMEQEYQEDALELLQLARSLTRDPQLISRIENRLGEIRRAPEQNMDQEMEHGMGWELAESGSSDDPEAVEEAADEETFRVLCGALPKEIRTEYLSYGGSFQAGYLALNQGAFETAAEHLFRAMEEYPSQDSYIPLELATAYLNLGQLDDARPLLESFLQHHPHALPGYQVLCEVLWETGSFDQAESLLDGCPDDVKDSVAFFMMRGETMVRSGRLDESISFYQGILESYGWNESIGLMLASTKERSGDREGALEGYTQIMNQCIGCHSRIDPMIKRKVADLSLDLGRISVPVLEMYLSLVQEDPGNADIHYQKISSIYAAMGNDEEARRFQAFARQASEKRG